VTDETESGGDVVAVSRQAPETVFGLLGDDTRVGILQAMGETPDDVVSFSTLRERVGTRDSGRFNYHLRKLLGTFVRKTEGGYELTHAGRQIIGAMYAGTYTANATIESIRTDGDCPVCGGPIVASYADELVHMDCSECGEWYNEFAFPPGSIDQFSRDELPHAFDRWMMLVFERITAGFCHTCAGRMVGELVLDDPEDQFGGMPGHVEYECRRCGSTASASGTMPVRIHPAVGGFLFDHGFDCRSDPSWSMWSSIDSLDATVRTRDPPSLAVEIRRGDDAVTAVVTADAAVTDVRRRERDE
jgi:ribosomal protein S27AE